MLSISSSGRVAVKRRARREVTWNGGTEYGVLGREMQYLSEGWW